MGWVGLIEARVWIDAEVTHLGIVRGAWLALGLGDGLSKGGSGSTGEGPGAPTWVLGEDILGLGVESV